MKNFSRILGILLMSGFVTANSDCQHSEYNEECFCTNYDSSIVMDCPPATDGNTVNFSIEYSSRSYVQITCVNNPSWSTFHYEIRSTTQEVEKFVLKNCSLDDTVNLNEIARLVGAENAKKLEFSNNLRHKNLILMKDHFRGFNEVQSLIITENYLLGELDEDLLEYLPKLTALFLRNNKIKSIPEKFFQYVPKITTIELGNNNIEKFMPGTFKNLKELKLLNLWSNELIELDGNLFSDLVSLNTLDLHNNNLTTLPQGVFDKVGKLKIVNLSGSPLHTLPHGLFKNNENLTIIRFRMERELKTLPSGLFSNLTRLTDLQLDSCSLETIPEDLFSGSTQLKKIDLGRNFVRTLPAKIFDGLVNLEKLTLNDNNIEELPNNLFISCKRLKELDLKQNNMKNISSFLFSGLGSLEKLLMKNNRVSNIEPTAFAPLKNVAVIDLSYNKISDLKIASSEYGEISIFNACRRLVKLYLSHNEIKLMYGDWIITPQETFSLLDLSHNKIQELAKEDLDFKHSKDFTLYLSDNNISRIDLSGDFEQRFQDERRYFIRLDIENNPITCDCFLYDFIRYLDGEMNDTVRNRLTIKIGSMECSSPKELQGTLLTNLKSKDYTCIPSKYERYDNVTLCPKSCTKLMRPYDKTLIFDCSNKDLTEAPKTLCSLANREYFSELNLNDNFLEKIPALNRNGYERVKTLLLSQNEITTIPMDMFSSSLRTLQLHDNKIESLSEETLHQINSSLHSITLGGNPWSCNCDAREFQYFIQTSNFLITDVENVICQNSQQVIKALTVNELCPDEKKIIITISVLIAFMGLTIGCLAALYYNYQTEIKIWLYARQFCLWFVTEEELDKDKVYDAFISYSHKDEDFVISELVTKLEQGPRPFKLCLHFRDWLAGEWIPNQIALSVQHSKRTVVVVSPNFIKSEWGKHEFRMAHSQALKDERIRVIVILYGDIDQNDIQELELKAYLEMNTFVKWGDPWFWEKLRYGLPHKPILSNKTQGSRIYKRQHPSAQLSFMKPPESDLSPLQENVNKNVQNGTVFIEMSDDESKKLNVNC